MPLAKGDPVCVDFARARLVPALGITDTISMIGSGPEWLPGTIEDLRADGSYVVRLDLQFKDGSDPSRVLAPEAAVRVRSAGSNCESPAP